MSIDNRT